VLGGGRYDGLSEELGGPKAPGIGFAIGEDRLVLALQAQRKETETALRAMVIPLGKDAAGNGMNRHALRLAKQLREAGLAVDVSDETFRLKKSFETAEKLGATYAVLVGENEIAAGEYAVKNLASGEQVKVAAEGLADFLKA
jgi:histidyl-tRNA synthetase